MGEWMMEGRAEEPRGPPYLLHAAEEREGGPGRRATSTNDTATLRHCCYRKAMALKLLQKTPYTSFFHLQFSPFLFYFKTSEFSVI